MLIKDVEKLIRIAKRAGLTKLKVGEVEFEFSPNHIPSPRGRPKKEKTTDELDAPFSPEQTLMWSVQEVV